jgi:hypothetical protein
LLNPNGILFGPDAELDVQGSFLATTADSFMFSGGEMFSAITPNAPPLLSVNVTSGIQFGGTPQGNITSTGHLETGQDLALLGNQLYLEGQLMAGGNLTLQAQGTVTIRDTATNAFMAQAGKDLTIQGNQGIDIWTLQHLEQTPFVSGRDLLLISNGEISGDAHFESGGNLQFLTLTGTPGNFVSYHDPIIFADGDVIFGDYEGVALKVEATGSIQAGDIIITGPDTTLVADGSGSDEDLLASSSAAILRAGVQSVSSANLPQAGGGTTFTSGTSQSPGSIDVNLISTFNPDGSDGGPIILAADGDITLNENLESFSQVPAGDAGNGGNISISSISGNILANGRIESSSKTRTDGRTGDGGDISITSVSGDISIQRPIASFSLTQTDTGGDTGNGGDISISSVSGDISTHKLNASSDSVSGRASTGGLISLSSITGDITTTKDVETFSKSKTGDGGTGGSISISTTSGDILIEGFLRTFSQSVEGNSGDAGSITISSTSGDITTEKRLTSFSFVRSITGLSAGNAGDITISSTSGDITTNNRLNAFSSSLAESSDGGSGSGGNITISSVSGDISTSGLDSSSSFFSLNTTFLATPAPTGNAGDITVSSISGDISNNDFIASLSTSRNGDVNNGGNISLLTREGSIFNNNNLISTISASEVDGNTGTGGNVTLQAATSISDLEVSTVSSGGVSGNVEIQGTGNHLIISNLRLITSGQIETLHPAVNNRIIPLELSEFDRSGRTIITSAGDLTLDNVEILSDANRSADAGDVEIFSAGNMQLNNSQIRSNTNIDSSGDGGSVIITGVDSIILDNSLINTDTDGSGRAGDIRFLTPQLNIQNGAQVTAATNSLRKGAAGGGISIEADAITLSGDATEVSVSTSGPAAAGSIVVEPFASGSIEISTLGDGPQFSASTASGSNGQGGDIIVRDADIALLRNTELVTSSNGTGNAGNIIVEDVDVLLLRQDSLLQAGASANGDGGNIDIDATIVITVPNENNDILADTNSGTGGNIDITAAGILGFRAVDAFSSDLDSNGLNDISARSERGDDGNVILTTPNVDPDQGLLELPDNLADQSGLIAQQCLANAGEGQSAFVVTGRGGVPPSPGEVTRSETTALVDLETYGGSDSLTHSLAIPITDTNGQNTPQKASQNTPQLVEAQGWSINPDGEIELIAQMSDGVTQLSDTGYICSSEQKESTNVIPIEDS